MATDGWENQPDPRWVYVCTECGAVYDPLKWSPLDPGACGSRVVRWRRSALHMVEGSTEFAMYLMIPGLDVKPLCEKAHPHRFIDGAELERRVDAQMAEEEGGDGL